MATQPQLQLVFKRLRELMSNHADALSVLNDEPANYYLDTRHVMKNGKPLFFGAIRIGKRYVSYHLMPVYVNPDLLSRLSDPLRARMQGKSCFNFVSCDDGLFAELGELTRAGFEDYRRKGYIK